MKHNILPESWCVAKCSGVVNYMHEKYKFGLDFLNGESGYYGVEGKNRFIKNKPFGQLLTEEQFLYCIGEPIEGEEIEVSNGVCMKNSFNRILLCIKNNTAWCLGVDEEDCAYSYKNYRRKPLVFEIDKWAKEKAAFAEGKTIQCLRTDRHNDEWTDISEPSWSTYPVVLYRIKPEPKYAPFTREDWDLFKMKEVRNNPDDGVVVVIISCDNDVVRCGRVECTYQQAFDSIVFADGTPFGKLIEE